MVETDVVVSSACDRFLCMRFVWMVESAECTFAYLEAGGMVEEAGRDWRPE